MSAAKFKMWLNKAGDGVVDRATLKKLTGRFLSEAANEMGGERVYIPCRAAPDSRAMLTALRLHDMGLSFEECQEAVDQKLSKTTFYRRKRDQIDLAGMAELEVRAMKAGNTGDFVYAFGFTGDDERDNWVKVGFSWCPSSRVKGFIPKTDLVLTDAAIVLVPQVRGFGAYVEREVHKRLAEFRGPGEWFQLPGFVDEALEMILATTTELVGQPRFIYRA